MALQEYKPWQLPPTEASKKLISSPMLMSVAVALFLTGGAFLVRDGGFSTIQTLLGALAQETPKSFWHFGEFHQSLTCHEFHWHERVPSEAKIP
jgi:hypothetical protein